MTRPACLLLLLCASCVSSADQGSARPVDTLAVQAAASLAAPMRAVLDSFARRTGAVVTEEHGASLDLARRITELHRVPDVVALADQEVFPQLLIPDAASWYAAFARNRMVIAYTARSRHAAEISPSNWRDVVGRSDVLLGRTDPVQAPAGYRALLMYRLAERFYHEPGLAARLEALTPPTRIRGNAAELAALLEAGELDYIVEYESLARSHHFQYVVLPGEIDLGDPALASTYATAEVRVARGKDSAQIVGAPILFGLSIPRQAPHPKTAERFVAFLLGAKGQTLLRRAGVDALVTPVLVGDAVPEAVRAVAGGVVRP